MISVFVIKACDLSLASILEIMSMFFNIISEKDELLSVDCSYMVDVDKKKAPE